MKLFFEYHFDAAHRLTFHKGKCYNLHGHRWDVKVEIDSKISEDEDMIIDFNEIKRIVNAYDHNTILMDNEKNSELIKVLQDEALDVMVIDCEPTVENLVVIIWQKISSVLRESDKVKVTIFESPGAGAEYGGE